MTNIYTINNKIIIFLFVVICFLTTFTIVSDNLDDNFPLFNNTLSIDDDEDSLFSYMIENNVSFVFCLAITFLIQTKETFNRIIYIFSIFHKRAPPLSLTA